jgi:hypothetical protein
MTGGSAFDTFLESFLWVGPRFGDNEVFLWEEGVLGLSEPATIQLDYIGKEAFFADNIFRWDGVDIFSTGPSNPLITGQTAAAPFPPAALDTYMVPGVVDAGPLPFSFLITEIGEEELNDGNPDIAFWPIPSDVDSNPINFGTVVYAMLDDENAVDFDHDDMIVRLTAMPVPEPTSVALAATGVPMLAGWMLRRRQSRRAAAAAC